MASATSRLERFSSEFDATWGRLYVPHVPNIMFTVEQPWRYNRPFESRIKDGLYKLVRHGALKWALVGGDVSQYPEPGAIRYACLFEVVNWASELQGCVGAGNSIGWSKGAQCVMNSRDTMKILDAAWLKVVDPMIEIVTL